MTTPTIERNSTPALNCLSDSRRTVTLRVDNEVRGKSVETSEFALPDAEFEI